MVKYFFIILLSTLYFPFVSAGDNSQIVDAIKSSDDFSTYQDVFISVSEKLVNSGKCSLPELKEMGGWVRSQIHNPKPIYFTYCGGMHRNNRIYVDVVSGKTFK